VQIKFSVLENMAIFGIVARTTKINFD